MSDTSSNTTLNTYLTSNKELFNSKGFRTLVEASPLTSIEGSIISYNKDTSIIFCTECLENLTKGNYSKHLKTKHSRVYKSYREGSTLESIDNTIEGIDSTNLETLELKLEYNKYYFTSLDINYSGYKCRDCLKVSPIRKNIRTHYNEVHSKLDSKNKERVLYIIEDVPLQLIKAYNKNTKLYFIPKLPSTSKITSSISSNPEGDPSSSSNSSNIDNNEDSTLDSNRVASLLNRYSTSNDTRETNPITILESNRKLLNSYIKKSSILSFLKDKNRTIIGNLIYRLNSDIIDPNIELYTNTTNINLEDIFILKKDNFNILEDTIYECLSTISTKIERFSIIERQRLLSTKKDTREFKDFIALDSSSTKQTYYYIFSNLIIFIIKVLFIRGSTFKPETDYLKEEIFNTIKDITIPDKIKLLIGRLCSFDFDNYKENEAKFALILSTISRVLLEDKLSLGRSNNSISNNLVIFYFNCLNLNKSTLELDEVLGIGQKTSYILYNTRLLVLGYYYFIDNSDPIDITLEQYEFDDYINFFLKEDSKNYFEYLNTFRPYLRKLGSSSVSTNYPIFEVEPNIIELDSYKYPIVRVKEFYTSILRELEDILVEKLLFKNSIDSLELDFDNINDTSLLNRVDNSLQSIDIFKRVGSSNYILRQVLRKSSLAKKELFKGLKNKGNDIIFNIRGVERYNTNINRFLELLALSIHLLGGSPLRGTEINTIFYKNIETKLRSVIFNRDIGLIGITTTYFKGANITRKEKDNLRYLPPLLGKIVIVYITYILPFKELIAKEVFRLENPQTPFLLVKDTKEIESTNLSNILKRESSKFFKQGLTI